MGDGFIWIMWVIALIGGVIIGYEIAHMSDVHITTIDTQTLQGRLFCKEFYNQACGATCVTNESLIYDCLTNYRIVS